MDQPNRIAAENLKRLASNPYPGRGIVLGISADGRHLLQVYWIMGRSENSRNRIFVRDGTELRTEPANPARTTDPSLVIYTAMRELPGHYLVTNGDHTDTLYHGLTAGLTFPQVLLTRVHEPDEPNWTSRIAGEFDRVRVMNTAWLGIIKANPFDPVTSIRQFFHYERLYPGFGWCVTTYTGDGDPLPGFVGEPYLLPLKGEWGDLLDSMWEHLDENNRISMAIKAINVKSGRSEIIHRNRFQSVTAAGNRHG